MHGGVAVVDDNGDAKLNVIGGSIDDANGDDILVISISVVLVLTATGNRGDTAA